MDSPADRSGLARRYAMVRQRTEALAVALSPEDQGLQSMPDASPTKWHRAHTTWFFETFVLVPHLPGYRPFDPDYGYLFNSYYEAVGPRHPRPQRGMLSRPGVGDIARYRAHVDAAMERLSVAAAGPSWQAASALIELGLNHEEQHQELILMDIKHALSLNPLLPAYAPARPSPARAASALEFVEFPGGLREIGHGGAGFAFDNESPRHKVWLAPFRLASRLVTVGEYLAFIADDGYRRAELWLSDGWATVRQEGWTAPLYWRATGQGWTIFTLAGARPLDLAEPVCHVSYYEAEAFARWAGKRLPTEAEWEIAAVEAGVALDGNLMDRGIYHPQPAEPGAAGLAQMVGDVWEWTQSPYSPYPGYRPAAGAVGEYNGKFMVNQMVLRGGAAVTPPGHVRLSYRNFFPPAARWPFGGIRLAEDA
ncbi:MAG TPA: ergothioneine biosynthesis protein EgtB [Stellaceae bacterium]|nr:ergothioneine biosynthesis protein EgtB [Stellaceae bacterium]